MNNVKTAVKLTREDVLQKYEEAKKIWTNQKVIAQAVKIRVVTEGKNGKLYWTHACNVDFCIFYHMAPIEDITADLEEIAEISVYYIVDFAKNSLYGNHTPPTIRQTLIWIPEKYLSLATAMKLDIKEWDRQVYDGIRMVTLKLYSGKIPNVIERMAMSFNGC